MDDLGQGRNVHVEGDQASDEDSKSEGVYTDNVDVGKKAIKDKKERKELDDETAWASYQRKRKEKRKEKKQLVKQQKD